MNENAPLRLLRKSGYAVFCDRIYADGEKKVRYTVNPALLALLEKKLAHDGNFYRCPWHGFHDYLGGDRFSYRSYKGVFGEDLSLQIVVSRETFDGDADCDEYNTEDLVNIVAHNSKEVAWPKLKRASRALFKPVRKAWALGKWLITPEDERVS